MRYLVFIIMLVSTAKSQTKDELHQLAHKNFFNTHFFENGRGMTLTPNISRYFSFFQQPQGKDKKTNLIMRPVYRTILEGRYGLNVVNNKVVGLFNVPYKNMNIGVLGCSACHGGKAAGIMIPGLGNKTIDVYQIGIDAKRIQKLWAKTQKKSDEYKKIHSVAMNFANVLSDAKIGNLTKGLVPDSVIKTFFYKDNGLQYPQMGRAQVKVPHLWGFKQKMKAGVFSSGEFSGENSSWAFGAELFASDSSEHLRAIEPKLNKFVDETLANLLPPPYPFEIKPLAVERGKDLFDLTCIKCHGDHQRDEKGYPVYTQPKFIKLSKVETDSDRANAVDPELRRLIQKSTGADLLLMNPEKEKGYLAPKLWGIWSRFPYLHNGSVPTIYHLMIKPKSRPQFFSMKKAGEKHRFDQNKLGLTLPVKNTKQFIKMQKKALNNYRSIYHIKRDGHSNSGHYFKFMDDFSEQDRMDIIEYLKTL